MDNERSLLRRAASSQLEAVPSGADPVADAPDLAAAAAAIWAVQHAATSGGHDECPPADEEQLTCWTCGQVFHSPSSFVDHLQRKTPLVRLECPSCQQELFFVNECQAVSHTRKHQPVGASALQLGSAAGEDVEDGGAVLTPRLQLGPAEAAAAGAGSCGRAAGAAAVEQLLQPGSTVDGGKADGAALASLLQPGSTAGIGSGRAASVAPLLPQHSLVPGNSSETAMIVDSDSDDSDISGRLVIDFSDRSGCADGSDPEDSEAIADPAMAVDEHPAVRLPVPQTVTELPSAIAVAPEAGPSVPATVTASVQLATVAELGTATITTLGPANVTTLQPAIVTTLRPVAVTTLVPVAVTTLVPVTISTFVPVTVVPANVTVVSTTIEWVPTTLLVLQLTLIPPPPPGLHNLASQNHL